MVGWHTWSPLLAFVVGTAGAPALDPRIDTDQPGFDRYLHVAYFHPSDREPAAGYEERIDRIVTDVQAFYREQMQANGYGELAFPLQRHENRQLVIHVTQGTEPFRYYDHTKGGEVRDCVKAVLAQAGIDAETETILIFSNLIETDGDKLDSDCPYYGGGSHRSGTAWVTDHELLDALNLPKTEPFIIDRDRSYSVGKYNTVQMGGVAHELGHALGLPHVKATREQAEAFGTTLMGSGNYTYREELRGEGKGSFLHPTSAAILSSHPLFRRSNRGKDREVECDLVELAASYADEAIALEGRVQSSLPVYGVNVYNDIDGGSDYDALAWNGNVDGEGRFRVSVSEFVPGHYELRLRLLHTNGAEETFDYGYGVNDDGEPDHHLVNLGFHLRQAVSALQAGDAGQAEACADAAVRLARAVPVEERTEAQEDLVRKARFIARQVDAEPPTVEPVTAAEVTADRKSVSLSELAWESASVGWIKPARDRIPEGEVGRFLESGKRFHERGLYAHAPSSYTFRLGGVWTRFTTACGLQNGHAGSVVFVVKADAVEVFRSEVVKDCEERELDLDMAGVDLLELMVEPTDDGNNSDWGVWFSPRLTR